MTSNQQITVDAAALRRGIELAGSLVQRHSRMPILGTVKVTANGAFVIESTDLDSGARVQLADGKYGAPAKHTDLAFALPSPSHLRTAIGHSGAILVNIGRKDKETRVRFASGQLSADLATLPAEEFPTFDTIHYPKFAAMLGAHELRQIARVTSAISTQETRYYLNGVCVHKIGEWLWRFAATDGHRLMAIDLALPDMDGAIPDGTIIPSKWLRLALRHFAKTKTGALLTFGQTLVRNSGDGVQLPIEQPGAPRIAIEGDLGDVNLSLTGKLIDGTFPDYNRVIPTGYSLIVRLQRADLTQAIRALSGLATEKTRAVKMTFETGSVAISLLSPDLGEGVFRVNAQHNMADGSSIGMNGRYVLENLAAFEGDEIELHFDEPARFGSAPILFRDPADTSFLAVLMPMRV